MISYRPFFKTILDKNITEYNLVYKQGVHSNTIYRMKKGMPITTSTLDTLCFILKCNVSDVIEYIEEDK